MSNAEILSLISMISFVVAAVSFALAVFLWFAFKIPSVIGDLSGRTAKKSIARMRSNNEKSGGQGYRPSSTNASRGKLTDSMHTSEKLTGGKTAKSAKKKAQDDLHPETGLLESNLASGADNLQTELLNSSEATEILHSSSMETEILDAGGATEMLDGCEATGILEDDGTTASLAAEPKTTRKRTGGKQLRMLDNVMLIHTSEVIS